jgi:hypothetical protein
VVPEGWKTVLVFAACAIDTLIAQADRIMVLDRLLASAIDPAEFRLRMAALLRENWTDRSAGSNLLVIIPRER